MVLIYNSPKWLEIPIPVAAILTHGQIHHVLANECVVAWIIASDVGVSTSCPKIATGKALFHSLSAIKRTWFMVNVIYSIYNYSLPPCPSSNCALDELQNMTQVFFAMWPCVVECACECLCVRVRARDISVVIGHPNDYNIFLST